MCLALSGHDMSPEVHCNLCNHCYTFGMPDPRPGIRCVQYLSEVHKKVPNEFGHQVEPLKSRTDIRDLNHHWMSNRYPQTSDRCQKWIQNIIRCQKWIQNITWCQGRSLGPPTDVHTRGGTSKAHHENVLDTCRILQVSSHPPSFSQGNPLHF